MSWRSWQVDVKTSGHFSFGDDGRNFLIGGSDIHLLDLADVENCKSVVKS
jgi:hypothetical protein